MLIIGALMYLYGHDTVQESQSLSGQLSRWLSGDAQKKYEDAKLLEAIGTITSIISAFLALLGVVLTGCGLIMNNPGTLKKI